MSLMTMDDAEIIGRVESTGLGACPPPEAAFLNKRAWTDRNWCLAYARVFASQAAKAASLGIASEAARLSALARAIMRCCPPAQAPAPTGGRHGSATLVQLPTGAVRVLTGEGGDVVRKAWREFRLL